MKSRIMLIMALSIIIILAGSSTLNAYSGGTGEPNDPYQIADACDLLELAANTSDYSKCFILTADINMKGEVFTKAVFEGPVGTAFTGMLDGGGHKITNLAINGNNLIDGLGLFREINASGSIRNLGLENCAISAPNSYYVGSLVGRNSGNISGCYATGTIGGDNTQLVGSLVGDNYGDTATISDCYSTGSVNSGDAVGGLVGFNGGRGSIRHCYSTSSVTGSSDVGGLVGYNRWYGSISNCYSTGTTSGSEAVGGLVGYNNEDASISDCHSTSTVSGISDSQYIGGIVGHSQGGSISDCNSMGAVSGYTSIGGLIGRNTSGNIINCNSSGDVNGSGDYVGGLVGWRSSYDSITDCYSTGIVNGGNNCVGGLIGYCYGSNIIRCYFMGSVTGTGNWVGGLAGLYSSASLTNCYSTGSVTGGFAVGGLLGINDYATSSNCYSTCDVNGGDVVGGLAGSNYFGNITDCYSTGMVSSSGQSFGGLLGGMEGYSAIVIGSFWDTQTSGQTTSAGGTGKTTAEMKTLSTFTSAGWDFVNAWGIGNGQTYPYLKPFNGFNSADLDHSGTVDFVDFAILAANWLDGH